MQPQTTSNQNLAPKAHLAKLDEIKGQLSVFISKIKIVEIKSPEQQIEVTSDFKLLKDKSKAVEDLRKVVLAPYKNQVDDINDAAKSIQSLLETPLKAIESELLKWNRVLAQRRQEEEERIRKKNEEDRLAAQKLIDEAKENAEFEASLGQVDQAQETVLVAENQAQTAAKRIDKVENRELKQAAQMKVKGVRKSWKLTVVDPKKVPQEYLMVDEVKLRAAFVASGWKLEVPGVRTFEEESMTGRS